MDIRSDFQKRLSYVELGKKYHMDPGTAKRYAQSPEKPEYTLSEPKPTKMDPYKQIVDEWLAEAPYSARRILEKLREMGFDGGCSIVKAYVYPPWLFQWLAAQLACPRLSWFFLQLPLLFTPLCPTCHAAVIGLLISLIVKVQVSSKMPINF